MTTTKLTLVALLLLACTPGRIATSGGPLGDDGSTDSESDGDGNPPPDAPMDVPGDGDGDGVDLLEPTPVDVPTGGWCCECSLVGFIGVRVCVDALEAECEALWCDGPTADACEEAC